MHADGCSGRSETMLRYEYPESEMKVLDSVLLDDVLCLLMMMISELFKLSRVAGSGSDLGQLEMWSAQQGVMSKSKREREAHCSSSAGCLTSKLCTAGAGTGAAAVKERAERDRESRSDGRGKESAATMARSG
eukprot:1302918-Rhodomonas_salina.4